MALTCYEWCKANKINWRDEEVKKTIGPLYHQYLCSHFTDTEFASLQARFEEKCSSMHGFSAHKDAAGFYTDIATFSAWEGFIDAELDSVRQSN